MTEVVNLFGDEWAEEGTRPGWQVRALPLRERLGGELLGATLYELLPGSAICPFHAHYGEEELAYVLRGRVRLRTPGGEQQLSEGDVAVFPCGPGGGHLLRNESEEPARVLFVSTLSDPEVCVYPDSGKVGVWAGHARRDGERLSLIVPQAAAVDYWEGEE